MSTVRIDDIYPLSSLQQIWVKNGRGPRRAEHHKHLGWQYAGALNADALSCAWQALTDRHAALRSAFFWQGLDEPVQVVGSHATASIVFHDLRSLETEAQEERLTSLLVEDRDAGFDLASAPLSRLIVMTIADDLHRIVWSMEGPVVDSWSQPIVIRELFRAYEAREHGRGPSFPPPPSYRDFVAWRSRCAFEGAEPFWRRELAPYQGLTPVCDRPADSTGADVLPEHAEQVVPVSQGAMTKLEAVAKAHQLTLNALVMGTWATVLARHCQKDFVVFGVTLSGRSPSVPGVERMVGFFMNILPVPVKLHLDESFVQWAGRLQALLLGIRQYQHLPATLPASWCGPGAGPFLFESLFVFENYPVQSPGEPTVVGVDFRETQGVVVSNFPLTVIVSKGWEWMQMLYDARRMDHKTVSRLLRDFNKSLDDVADSPQRRVGDFV